jgi:uncharacterized protein
LTRATLLVTAVLLLAQCLIAALLLRVFQQRLSGRRRIAAWCGLAAFEVLVAVGYVAFEPMRLPGLFTTVVGAGALVYLVTSTAVLVLYFIFRPIRRRLHAETDPSRRRALNWAGNLILASPVAAVSYGMFVQRTDFVVRELDVPIPGLPASLENLRLLHISDIHLSPFLSELELARLIDATVDLKPHVAFVTGDLITARGDPLEACVRQLARIKADAGVFGCMGNHEKYAHSEDATSELASRVGIRFLRQEAAPLRFGGSVLNVVGVDYQPVRYRGRFLQGAEHLPDPAAVNLLLSHNPQVFPSAARQGYDLVLAGHTHGGQVNIEILGESLNPALFFTHYVYGLYHLGRSAAYVSRGVGTIGMPVRLGAPPEVSLLRLKKA